MKKLCAPRDMTSESAVCVLSFMQISLCEKNTAEKTHDFRHQADDDIDDMRNNIEMKLTGRAGVRREKHEGCVQFSDIQKRLLQTLCCVEHSCFSDLPVEFMRDHI